MPIVFLPCVSPYSLSCVYCGVSFRSEYQKALGLRNKGDYPKEWSLCQMMSAEAILRGGDEGKKRLEEVPFVHWCYTYLVFSRYYLLPSYNLVSLTPDLYQSFDYLKEYSAPSDSTFICLIRFYGTEGDSENAAKYALFLVSGALSIPDMSPLFVSVRWESLLLVNALGGFYAELVCVSLFHRVAAESGRSSVYSHLLASQGQVLLFICIIVSC